MSKNSCKIEGPIPISKDNPSITRIDEKCIGCGLCSKICQEKVGIHYHPKKTKKGVCINCGQCLLNCPVGAIVPKYCYKRIMNYIKDTSKTIICYTSPAIRVAIGDEFGFSLGENVEKKLVTALKKIGFHYVFDTTFGADLTIMEEASEFVKRVKERKKLPQFTSCCPSWVKYLEIYYPDLIPHLSSCKSPIGMQGKMIKTYFSEMNSISSNDIVTVAITPCTAKKAEIKREEIEDCDFVITTTELAMMLREEGIHLGELEDSAYDRIMGLGSNAGLKFGISTGVLESTLRYAYKLIEKKDFNENLIEYQDVDGYENMKEITIIMGRKRFKLLACTGMQNISKLIESKDYQKYDFIEVMNCHGGCIGGGGQPLKIISKQTEVIQKRKDGLLEKKNHLDIVNCYSNQEIIDIYHSYLEKPLSDKAIKLLHTKYTDKSSILGE